MPVSRRLELVNYSASHGSLVIEDDFENEFVYLQKPTPFSFWSGGRSECSVSGNLFQTSAALHPYQFYGPASRAVCTVQKKSRPI